MAYVTIWMREKPERRHGFAHGNNIGQEQRLIARTVKIHTHAKREQEIAREENDRDRDSETAFELDGSR